MITHAVRSLRTLFVVAASLLLVSACDGDDPTGPEGLAGLYEATTFQVTPDGEGPIDVLAAGGSLRMVLNTDLTTTGTLVIPGSITGEGDLTLSMAGTYTHTGNTVAFAQAEDSFVRDLEWAVSGTNLLVTNQAAGGARFTITLTRQ